jgi:hypothetical protein
MPSAARYSSGRSSSGTPSMVEIVHSGRCFDSSSTTSPPPRSTNSSTTRAPSPAMASSSWATRRGVKAPLTMRRSFVWRGASMMRNEAFSSSSSTGMSASPTPWPEQNRAGDRLTCWRSAYRVTAQ